jgi:plastocyanin
MRHPSSIAGRRAARAAALALFLAPAVPQALWAAQIEGSVEILAQDGRAIEDRSNAVVYLDEVAGNKGFRAKGPRPRMSSKNMRFEPEVLPILAGSTVEFPNLDKVLHNVFSLSKAKPFDLGLYQAGETKSIAFEETGLVKVYCNVHEDMAAYILVLGNPHFTLTDKEGNFTLPDVPPGTYKLVCWYRFGDAMEKDVVITKTQTVQVGGEGKAGGVTFKLVKTRDKTKHKNKWGKDYTGKY